ncbi:smoothelin-like [Xenia sp. Carnegie-2017]|uniref:smoothelin-like n=1 Tax=Xenia sp. Carnegie-2017 TaxID=2897299 RepID=UPI001F03E1BB|nr:smoothelin-like [Xenia sp. Carnegie-2017]
MGSNELADLKAEEATLRRKLESTRDLSERRQLRALLHTLKEKREQNEQELMKDCKNNNIPPATSWAKDKEVRFTNFTKPLEKVDSGSNILELRSRRRSVAKPPPSTNFLVNKLSNVMQREKAARTSSPVRGVNAFKKRFENLDSNNNRVENRPPVKTFQTSVMIRPIETEKKGDAEIHHPNRNALRSRRRSIAKLQVSKAEKVSSPICGATETDGASARDARFQRRLSRTRMHPKVENATEGGKSIKPNVSGSPAERMAFFQQAAQKEKIVETKQPVKPATVIPAGKTEQNKENNTQNAPCVEKVPRRSPPKKKPQLKRQMSVSQLVLQWCKEQTEEYEGVNITNFSASFADGLAMAALIHKFNPSLFDFNSLKPGDRGRNFTTAFQAAEKVGIAVLLDVEDLVRMKKPEPRSIQTQVQMIFSKYRPKDLDTSQLTIA